MDKTLQDLAWSCLPKGFKEEVKQMWSVEVDCATKYKSELHKHRAQLLYELFGEHLHWQNNLTSDAEEEELLTVSRKRVQEMYKNNCDEIRRENISSSDKDCYEYANEVLKTLFGPKCHPDDTKDDTMGGAMESNVDSLEPKPAEPKFKVGDIVRFKYCCTTCRIDGFKMSDGVMLYQVGEVWAEESDLEPYTEPTETFTDDCQSQCKSQEFDDILKKGFSKERRLNIAAMIMAAMMQNAKWGDKYSHIATISCAAADALLAEWCKD